MGDIRTHLKLRRRFGCEQYRLAASSPLDLAQPNLAALGLGLSHEDARMKKRPLDDFNPHRFGLKLAHAAAIGIENTRAITKEYRLLSCGQKRSPA